MTSEGTLHVDDTVDGAYSLSARMQRDDQIEALGFLVDSIEGTVV